MRPTENIENSIKKLRYKAGTQAHRRILGNVLQAREGSEKPLVPQPNIWRIIMRSPITKFGAAAVIILAVAFGLHIFNNATPRAWAVEQTIDALKTIQTLTITGVDRYGSENPPFTCWVRFPNADYPYLSMRYECAKKTVVVNADQVYEYWTDESVVKISSGSKFDDLKIWYKAAQLNPWISIKMLDTIRLFAEDWKEAYAKDPQTGKDIALITCKYRSANMSFWFVVDLETKLITEGKNWRNLDFDGLPNCYAKQITYYEYIPDETFDFEIPEGVKVIDRAREEKSRELFNKAENMCLEEKRYKEAIGVFEQIFQQYSDLNVGEESLMMIGICYDNLGQRDKAIEAYERSIREYPDLKGWIETSYFYLGLTYLEAGENEKAIDAFEKTLEMGKGTRAPNAFPLKQAREELNKLQASQ